MPPSWAMGCHYLAGSSGHYAKDTRRCPERIYAQWTREQIQHVGLWPAELPLLDQD